MRSCSFTFDWNELKTLDDSETYAKYSQVTRQGEHREGRREEEEGMGERRRGHEGEMPPLSSRDQLHSDLCQHV